MNIKKSILLALCSLVLVACGKDSDAESQLNNGVTPTETINLSIEADAEEEVPIQIIGEDNQTEARLAQEINTSTWKTVQPFIAEKNLLVRVAVRRPGITPVYNDVEFVKVANQRKLKFSGELKVPSGNGKLEVAAIVIKEVGQGGRVFATVEGNKVKTIPNSGLMQPTVISGKQVIESKVPYVAQWTALQARPVINKLTFKPSGALVRVKITNTSSQDHTVKAIRICSNNLAMQWEYDFFSMPAGNSVNPQDAKLLAGQPLNNGTVNMASTVLNLPSPTKIAKTKSSTSWYYFYAMPVGGATEYPYTEIKVLTELSPEKFFYGWASSHRFQQGTTPIQLRMVEPTPGLAFGSHFPEQRIPVYHLPRTEDGYVKILSGKQPPYQLVDPREYDIARDSYSVEEIETLSQHPLNIAGKTYKLPSRTDIHNISSKFSVVNPLNYSVSLIRTDKLKAFQSIFSYTGTNNPANTPVYTTQFEDKARRYYTALRTEEIGEYIKLTYRYLGPCFSRGYTALFSESFWKEDWPIDFHVYIRMLPSYDGYATSDVILDNDRKYVYQMRPVTRKLRSQPVNRPLRPQRISHVHLMLEEAERPTHFVIPFPSN